MYQYKLKGKFEIKISLMLLQSVHKNQNILNLTL